MKYTLENIEMGERLDDGTGSRFVSWVFCVDGNAVGEEEGLWFYGWKTDGEIAAELRKQLRAAKGAYEVNHLKSIEL